MLVIGSAADNVAVAQQHVHFQHGFVRQAVSEGGGFNPDAANCAADGDRLQLGHHCGHQSVCQCGIREGLVGHHPLGFDHAGLWVDRQHVLKVTYIERAILGLPITKQIGGRLAKTDVSAALLPQVFGKAVTTFLITHIGPL